MTFGERLRDILQLPEDASRREVVDAIDALLLRVLRAEYAAQEVRVAYWAQRVVLEAALTENGRLEEILFSPLTISEQIEAHAVLLRRAA